MVNQTSVVEILATSVVLPLKSNDAKPSADTAKFIIGAFIKSLPSDCAYTNAVEWQSLNLDKNDMT